MIKVKKKPGRTARLSAEELSLRTGRPLGAFVETNPSVTMMALDEVVLDQTQIQTHSQSSDNHPKDGWITVGAKTKSKGPHKAAPKDKSLAVLKVNKVDKGVVEEAISKIAGILALVSPAERSAVLSKVCGAFSYRPKGSSTKPTKQESKQKGPGKAKSSTPANKEKPAGEGKNSFNEKFSKTHAGRMLEFTSKVNSNGDMKLVHSVYQVHRFLLGVKTRSKIEDFGNAGGEVAKNFNPEQAVKQLAGYAVSLAKARGTDAGDSSLIQEYLEWGWCLLRNKMVPEEVKKTGLSPYDSTCEIPDATVQRTVAEKETRHHAVLEAKAKRAAARRSQSPNTQKRLRGATEEMPKQPTQSPEALDVSDDRME
jgi:hypothetical protein